MNGYCLPEPFFGSKVNQKKAMHAPSSDAVPKTYHIYIVFVCSPVERMGGEVNENHAGSLFATVGASRHHDECIRAHSSCCGESHQKGDGSVCQQHHIRSLPVPQPAGTHQAETNFNLLIKVNI